MIVKSLDPLYNSLKPSLLFHLTKRGTAKRGLLMRLSREISKPNLYTRDSTGSRWRASSPPLFSILIYSNDERSIRTWTQISTDQGCSFDSYSKQRRTIPSLEVYDISKSSYRSFDSRSNSKEKRIRYNVSKSLPSRIGRWRTDDSV